MSSGWGSPVEVSLVSCGCRSVGVLGARGALPPHLAEIADGLRQVRAELYTTRGGAAGILGAPDLIVTNPHVARGPRVLVRLADDRRVDAPLVTADRRADLAVLRMPRCEMAPAALADSDAVRVGALVVALGHPLGLRRTLTAGRPHAAGPPPPGGGPQPPPALRPPPPPTPGAPPPPPRAATRTHTHVCR